MRALTPLFLLSLLTASTAAAQDPDDPEAVQEENIFKDAGPAVESEAPPEEPPLPEPEPEPEPEPTTFGEVFVNVDSEGIPIYIDGEPTGVDAPAVVKDVPTGRRQIELRTDCTHYQTHVEVKPNQIVRVQGKMTDGTGALEIITTPPEAEIFIDGEARGPGPQTLWGLSCAEHTVRAVAKDHHDFETTLMVPAFITTPLRVDLDPMTEGVLVVSVQPLNARVVLDDVVVAEGPVTLDNIPTGEHTISVVLEGYPTSTETVTVKSDVITRLEVDLSAAPTAPAATDDATDDAPAIADAPPPDAPSSSGGGTPWGRIVLNSSVTALGLGAGGYAANQWLVAQDAYDVYIIEPDDGIAAQIWTDEISPRQQRAMFSGIAGGLLLAGGAALWITTDFTVAPTPTGLILTRRW